jgi:hypothetical protein
MGARMMCFSIAMALCLLSTQGVAGQISLNCYGNSMEIGASELLAFRVKIDPDRGLVIDIDADDGLSTSNEANGRIVETIQFSDTTINANERMWRLQKKDRLTAAPTEEKRLKIDRMAGRFDLKISNEKLSYVRGMCQLP